MANENKLIDLQGLKVVYSDIQNTLNGLVKKDTVQDTKTVTPSMSTQTITADEGKSLLVKVTVNPVDATLLENLDSDFRAANIKKDVEIFGVKGTFSSTSNGASATDIISGKEAFVNGKLITGDMPNAVVTSGTVTSLGYSDPTYDAETNKFHIDILGNVGAPSVDTAGYLSSSVGTKNPNKFEFLSSASLNKIALEAEYTSGDLTKKPTISKGGKVTGDTWTDASNGAATSTKPTTGPYVKVSSAPSTNTLTITPKVTTAGYGTTTSGEFSPTSWTGDVGADASDAYYIPIKEITYGSVTTTAPNSTSYPDVISDGITPKTSAQYVQITEGYSSNKRIKINAIPSKYKDTTEADAVPANVLSGKKFVNTSGLQTGTMTNNGAGTTTSLDSNTTTKTIAAGYWSSANTVSISVASLDAVKKAVNGTK